METSRKRSGERKREGEREREKERERRGGERVREKNKNKNSPVGNTLYPVLCGPLHRLLEDPRDVSGVVAVDSNLVPSKGIVLWPEQEPDVLDTVLGQSRGVGQGAEWKVELKW